MKRTRLQTATGLLLSATLFCGSLVPPAQRHAHAEGDLAHDHRHEQAEGRSVGGHGHHDHDHHHHPHHPPVDRQYLLQSAAIAHEHLSLWLIDLMIPLGDRSDTQEDDGSFLSRLGEDCVRTSVSDSLRYTNGVPPQVPVLPTFVRSTTAVQGTHQPPGVNSLCDRARHERSGVQLF